MASTVDPAFQRLALLTGVAAVQKLQETKVIVFGLGGVGGWCAEALVRSGIGAITLVDSDTVCVTNINRQTQATHATIGKEKTETLKQRLLEINPACNICAITKVFSGDTEKYFALEQYDYVIDAIDSLSCKLDLIEICFAYKKILFSSMGMAQKLDPVQLKTASIWKTQGCPLARLVRSGLRKRNFSGDFTVVYSAEHLPLHTEIASSCGTAQCLCPSKNNCDAGTQEWCSSKKVINGSAVTVTATAGMILASLTLQDVCKNLSTC
jgi:tRNA A37 threonylcarbamoyladenosine dehydratase